MKNTLTIIKITGLVALLVGATIGFLFFRAWQSNQRPKATEIAWSKDDIILGHQAVLNVTIRAPWHREIRTASPSSYPGFLPPIPDTATLRRGNLSLDGHRNWTVSIPLVATNPKSVEGLSLSLPLLPTKRPSPSTVNIALPPLAIHMPGNLPDLVRNPTDFILQDAKPTPTAISTGKDEPGFPWFPLIAALIVFGTMIIVYLRNQSGSVHTPAWQTALTDLSILENEKELPPDAFFSRLTDILKTYTAERFLIPATAKTSSEFLSSVYSLPDLPQVETMELPWLARLADDIKFAGHDPKSRDPSEALNLVRTFVQKTKPAPDPTTNA